MISNKFASLLLLTLNDFECPQKLKQLIISFLIENLTFASFSPDFIFYPDFFSRLNPIYEPFKKPEKVAPILSRASSSNEVDKPIEAITSDTKQMELLKKSNEYLLLCSSE